MLQSISIGFLVAAFFGAGLFNAIGTTATRNSFRRWGYPGWWCRFTGALEILIAILIAFSATRAAGLLLGAVTIAAAILTILRHREWSHLAPLGLFAALLVLAALTS